MSDTKVGRSPAEGFNRKFLAQQRLLVVPRRELSDRIERSSRFSTEKTRPTMIVLPAPSYNQDHEAAYKAGLAACRPHLHALKSFQQFVLVADAPQLSWSRATIFKPNFY